MVRQMNPDLKRIPGVDYNFSQNIEDNGEEAMSVPLTLNLIVITP